MPIVLSGGYRDVSRAGPDGPPTSTGHRDKAEEWREPNSNSTFKQRWPADPS
jgi:hypothetical protein